MSTIKKNTKSRKNLLSSQRLRESKLSTLMRLVFGQRKLIGGLLLGGAALFGMTGSSLGQTVILPDWGSPVTPHYNGDPENGDPSGVIELGSGGTYSAGYNGSELRYFFNDQDPQDATTEVQLILNVSNETANEAAAITAVALQTGDPLAGPGDRAVGYVTVLTTSVSLALASWELADFYLWDENFVGGIDFNSSLTVNGYGSLTGAYMNVETFSLTNGGTVNLSGAGSTIRVVDYLESAGSLNLGAGTNVYAVGSIDIAGTLTNAGDMMKIGSISANQIINSGDMLGIGSIEGNLTNALGGNVAINSYKGATLNNAGTFLATTLVDANSIVNSGDFMSAGAMMGGTLNNSGTLTNLSTVNMTGAMTNSGTWTSLGMVRGASLVNSGDLLVGSDLIVDGAIDNTGGTIAGFGAASSVKSNSINAGTVQNMISVITGHVTGGTDFYDIETLTVGTRGVNGGNLFVGGDLIGIDKVTIYGNATFDNIYVTGDNANPAFGEGSVYKVTGSISGYTHVIGVETLIVGSTQNAAGSLLCGTGDGAKYTTGTLAGATAGSAHAGTVAGYQYVQINDHLNNAGLIHGTGIGAKFQMIDTDGRTLNDLNNSGTISNFAYVATKDLTNEAGGVILGSGPGSIYEVGRIEDVKNHTGQQGNLVNDGSIYNIEKLLVTGTVVNDNEIYGSGKGSLMTVNTLGTGGVNAPTVLTNSAGNIISGYERMHVEGAVYNGVGSSIIGTGKGSVYIFNGKLDNKGLIDKVETLSFIGEIENEDGGIIIGSGYGSKLETPNLTNAGFILNYEKAEIEFDLYNTGTIVSTGNGSVWKVGRNLTNDGPGTYADGGMMENISQFIVGGDFSNTGRVATTGGDSIINVVGNLVNGSMISPFSLALPVYDATNAIIGYEQINVQGNILNSVGYSIIGTGYGSRIKGDSNLANAGLIGDYEKMVLAGNLVNTGVIVSTGKGSVYNIGGYVTNDGDGLNDGIIAEVETFLIDDYLRNGGLIQGTGTGSLLEVKGAILHNGYALINGQDALGGDVIGTIRNYESVLVDGSVLNTATSAILGTSSGRNSELSATGDLVNHGLIANYSQSVIGGNVTNTGTIQSVGKDSSFVVAGDVENGTDPGTTLTHWQAEQIATPGTDIREEHRAEFPAVQRVNSDLATRTDVAYIANYANYEVSGTVNNRSNGFIQATGVGSTYTMGALNNAGVLNDVETLNINGAAPSAFQVAVTGTVGDVGWNHQGNIYGRIDAGVVANAGDLVNRDGGLIVGTGTGSALTVSGNVYNMYGSTLRNFETARIAGSLANEGFIEFFGDTFVGGDFVNSAIYANGNNAVGGVMLTDTYNGRLGRLTVQGDATINGGELWIGGSGERLAVGKDYTVLTVNDGHLTVNQALQIRAINEYGFDTLLGDNYPLGHSSNVSASAVPRLFHAEGFYTDSEYWVSLRRDFVYGAPAITTNQKSMGTYLDSIAYTLNSQSDTYSEGDLFNVLSAIDNENIKGGNIPSADYGYTAGNDANYTYASPQYTQNGITTGALDVLDQLSGTIYADMSMMSMQNSWFIHQYIGNMLRPTVCLSVCCCDAADDGDCTCEYIGMAAKAKVGKTVDEDGTSFGFHMLRNFWGLSYGAVGNIYSDGNARGYEYSNAGLIVGGDFYRSCTGRAGVYFSYGNNGIRENGYYQKADISNYKVGMYGHRDFLWGNILGTAAVGMDGYKVTRQLQFGEIDRNSNYVDRIHRGDVSGMQYTAQVEQSWNYCLGRSVFQPFTGLTYTHLRVNGVQEWTDSGDRADNLYVTELSNHEYELDSMRSEFGLRLNRCLYRSHPSLVFNSRVSWVHEFGDTYATIENSFTNKNYDPQTQPYGNPYNTATNNAFNSNQYNVGRYSIQGVDIGRDFVWGGLGVNWNDPCRPLTLFASYDAFANGREMLHNGTVGFEFDW